MANFAPCQARAMDPGYFGGMNAILMALVLGGADPAPVAPPPSSTPSGMRVPRIAVYEITTSGLPHQLGPILTESLVAELRKLEGLSVIGMDEVRAMLDIEAQKQLVGCTDESCLADIAAALGVDIVVVGSAASVGEGNVFGLKRIDQREAKVVGQVNQRLERANGEEFLAVVGPSVEVLFPEAPLKAGRTRGVAPQLAVRLNPPPLDPWVFWTSASATGLALAVSGTASVVWAVSEQDLAAFAEKRVIDGGEFIKARDRADSLFALAATTWVVGAAFAAASGALVGFVDWAGYRQHGRAEDLQ